MTNTKIVANFINALQTQAQQAGGLDYALSFISSTLRELNLQGHEEEILIRNTQHLIELNDSPKSFKESFRYGH